MGALLKLLPRLFKVLKGAVQYVFIGLWAWISGETIIRRWSFYMEDHSEFYELLDGFIDVTWARQTWLEVYPYFAKGIWLIDQVMVWDIVRTFIAGFVSIFCIAVWFRLFMAARNFMASA